MTIAAETPTWEIVSAVATAAAVLLALADRARRLRPCVTGPGRSSSSSPVTRSPTPCRSQVLGSGSPTRWSSAWRSRTRARRRRHDAGRKLTDGGGVIRCSTRPSGPSAHRAPTASRTGCSSRRIPYSSGGQVCLSPSTAGPGCPRGRCRAGAFAVRRARRARCLPAPSKRCRRRCPHRPKSP